MGLIAIAAVSTALALGGCAEDSDGPYKVTLYSGGAVVREWDDVSSYTRWSESVIEVSVDGESFLINCGTVVIEPSKD
jgi:hypothetical protein